MRYLMVLGIFCLLVIAEKQACAKTQHAHVHDRADLSLVLDNPTTLTVDLEAPTQLIYGFEHEPRGADEKIYEERGLAKMREKISSMILLPENLGCQWKVTSFKVEKHREGSGEHRELRAQYRAECKGSLSGSEIFFGFQTFFRSLKVLNVQLLSDSQQLKQSVRSNKDSVKIK